MNTPNRLPTKMTMVECFAPMISYFLEVESTLEKNSTYPKAPQDVCNEAEAMLAKAEKTAQDKGKPKPDIQDCKFAMVAWVDEVFARYASWSLGYFPLQIKLFSTNNAGNDFYDKLSQLDENRSDAREFFITILQLGFVGEHYLDLGPGGTLEKIKQQQIKLLPFELPVIALLGRDYLTPQPYEMGDPPPLAPRINWLPYILAGLGAAAAVGLAVLYIMTRGPDKDELFQKIQAELRQFPCARFDVIRLYDDYSVEIQGYVSEDSDIKSVKEKISGIKGISKVEVDLESYQWPLCEMMGVLKTYTKIAAGDDGEPRIRPQNDDITYHEGEDLTVSITAPDYESYIYVTYLQNDGKVLHMMPVPGFENNILQPGQTMVLGKDGITKKFYTIQPPFGVDMIAIIITPVPLFLSPRPEVETAKSYLNALYGAFDRLHNQGYKDKIRSDYFFITTVP